MHDYREFTLLVKNKDDSFNTVGRQIIRQDVL